MKLYGCFNFLSFVILLSSSFRALSSVESFKRNCDKGDMMECYFLGKSLLNQGKTKEARVPLKKAYENGDSKACELLGEIAEKEGDLVEAEKYYILSCKFRESDCDQLAGLFVSSGRYGEAKDLYRKSCSADNLYGCASWELVNAKEKEFSGEARLKESCNKNIKTACNLISDLFFELKREKSNIYLPHLKKACDFGHKQACEALK